jgi:hypothetical protein
MVFLGLLLACAVPAWAGPGALVPWPPEVDYRPAGAEHRANGPGAVLPEGDGLWLFAATSHALWRLDAAGVVRERVPVEGFVHSLALGPDGGLAWVDLARRRVVEAARDGRVLRAWSLPAGVARVRRLIQFDGRLRLHTSFQETLTVPDSVGAPLRAWFALRREGSWFSPASPAVTVLATDGRVQLLLASPASGLTAGAPVVRRVGLGLGEPLLAAEVLGPTPGGGWWLRITLGSRDHARDEAVAVGSDGAVLLRTPLPARGTLSWPDTLFVTADGGLIGLTPTDAGIVRRDWGRP